MQKKLKRSLGLDKGGVQVVRCGEIERHAWKKQKTTTSERRLSRKQLEEGDRQSVNSVSQHRPRRRNISQPLR